MGPCTALVLERTDEVASNAPWEILGCRLVTRFSNNIRNNFGFLNRTRPESRDAPDKLFVQQGRKVFKDIVPLVSQLIADHLDTLDHKPHDVRRFWLHQANLNMNRQIAKRVLAARRRPKRRR